MTLLIDFAHPFPCGPNYLQFILFAGPIDDKQSNAKA
jgi:hypothetical protein